jgi:hypothetical protein
MLVEERVGSWQHFFTRSQSSELAPEERQKVNTVMARALHVQWVSGSPDKAESSFFKINTEGTPLDEIEEMLLRSRRKPLAIAARAIIRAGKGHKYWSAFTQVVATQIEQLASEVHVILFEPSLERPVKTLALPLGGSKNIRAALEVLLDFMRYATRKQNSNLPKITDGPDDSDGCLTVQALKTSLALARRITGNDSGSLGLHPAIYYYGPSGRHSGAMFMGTVSLIARHLANNDKSFFSKFTAVREKIEDVLVTHKDMIATILQKLISSQRTEKYESLLEQLIGALEKGESITDEWLVNASGLTGRALTGTTLPSATSFTEDDRSQIFINVALTAVPKCPICSGYLDMEKSVSYDHIDRVADGGKRGPDNGQLTHPYCNQAVKN